MKKSIKVLCIILTACVLLAGASLAASASAGENIITVIKEIIEKHIFYVDDVEVSEEEYNAAAAVQSQTTEKTIEHRLYTNTVYKINGQIVSAKEYENYFTAEEDKIPNKVYKITADKLTGMNAGSLGDYLSFETDNYGNITGAKVVSDKVVSATYKYSDYYMSYTEHSDDSYIFVTTGYGVIYQDTTETDMVFKSGCCETTGFEVCGEDLTVSKDLSEGQYLFKFVNDPNRAVINFSNVFEYVMLSVCE